MKKLVLSLVMGAMMLSSVVTASAKTVDTKSDANNATIAFSESQTVFYPQTEDPFGW